MTSEATSTEDDAVDNLFEDKSEETVETTEETEEVKGETEAEAPESEPPSDEEPKLVPIAAMHDYKRKWQEEKEAREKAESLIPREEVKAPDMYEDPEGYKAWVRDEVVREEEEKNINALKTKVDSSRSAMLESKEDYEEKEKAFMMLTMYDQSLSDKMHSSEDPALFAYERGAEYLESLVPKATTEEPVEAEEPEEKAPIVKGPRLATATSMASNTKPVEKEEGFDEMFEDQKY